MNLPADIFSDCNIYSVISLQNLLFCKSEFNFFIFFFWFFGSVLESCYRDFLTFPWFEPLTLPDDFLINEYFLFGGKTFNKLSQIQIVYFLSVWRFFWGFVLDLIVFLRLVLLQRDINFELCFDGLELIFVHVIVVNFCDAVVKIEDFTLICVNRNWKFDQIYQLFHVGVFQERKINGHTWNIRKRCF